MRAKKVKKEYVRVRKHLWKGGNSYSFCYPKPLLRLHWTSPEKPLKWGSGHQDSLFPQKGAVQPTMHFSTSQGHQFTRPWLVIKPLAWVGYLDCSQGLDHKAVGRMETDDSRVPVHIRCTRKQAEALPSSSVEDKRPTHKYSLPGYFHFDPNMMLYSTRLWATWYVLARSMCEPYRLTPGGLQQPFSDIHRIHRRHLGSPLGFGFTSSRPVKAAMPSGHQTSQLC